MVAMTITTTTVIAIATISTIITTLLLLLLLHLLLIVIVIIFIIPRTSSTPAQDLRSKNAHLLEAGSSEMGLGTGLTMGLGFRV